MKNKAYKYAVGQSVKFTDPDGGHSSGTYTVIQQISEAGNASIYLISNGTTEAEVYQSELKPAKKGGKA